MRHCSFIGILVLLPVAKGYSVFGREPINRPPIDHELDASRRRSILAAASVIFLPAVASLQSTSITTSSLEDSTMSIDESIQWIDDQCDRRFLHAVVASDYKFLYTNAAAPQSTISIETQPRLLDPKSFFELEEVLQNDPVQPSQAFLASNILQGDHAVSLWPVSGAHYAWMQRGGVLPCATQVDRSQIIVDGKDCGKESLDDVLGHEGSSWEVLVKSDSYLAVPKSMEEALREGLKKSFLV